MKLRYLAWIFVPIMIGGGVYLARSPTLRQWIFRSNPVLECPALLDLGERELGEVVVTPFKIANRGRGYLTIDNVQCPCACAGLEREEDGKFFRVNSLRLGPNEHAALVMRVLVQGTPGSRTESGVSFRTSDPTRPEASIVASTAKVNAGVTTVPTSVMFGTLSMGSEARQVLDVFDSSTQPRAIQRVESGNADRVSVRILPLDADLPVSHHVELGKRIGRLEVTPLTSVPGPLTSGVEIHLTGERRLPSVIAVSGRVAGLVEVSPSVVVLPRSSAGGPVYFGECVCRSTSNKPLIVTVDSPPADLSVIVAAGKDSTSQLLRIEWDPAKDAESSTTVRRKLSLRADVDGQTTTLELPIVCLRKGNP